MVGLDVVGRRRAVPRPGASVAHAGFARVGRRGRSCARRRGSCRTRRRPRSRSWRRTRRRAPGVPSRSTFGHRSETSSPMRKPALIRNAQIGNVRSVSMKPRNVRASSGLQWRGIVRCSGRPGRRGQGVHHHEPAPHGQLEGAGQRRPSQADRVGRQRLALLHAAALRQPALPLEDRLRRHVPQAAPAQQRPHVRLRVLAVVVAGLHRQPLIGVEPVEVQVEQGVDRHGRRRRASDRALAAEQLLAGPARLSGGSEPSFRDLRAAARQRVAAERRLEVPATFSVGVHALGSHWHGPDPPCENHRENRPTSQAARLWFSKCSHGTLAGNNPQAGKRCDLDFCGAPGEIRTPNLLIRSQMLYPLSYERWR